MRRLLFALIAGGILFAAPAAQAGGPGMLVGAAEDAVKADTLTQAKVQLDLLKLAGLDAVRVTAIWDPANGGLPGADTVLQLRNLTQAAQLDGIKVFVSVYPFGSRTTPLTDADQASFVGYAVSLARQIPALKNFIIGNEPNLNRFWLPQFGPNGEDVAAPAYTQLLAKTYDGLKAVSPDIVVWGGAISPRGIDRPGSGRDTHSPTVFIQDMGTAYRAMGRTTPIMDGLAIHPYPENSTIPPTFAHPLTTPIGIADYTKLVGLLQTAFDGTAQPGSTLPILYAEYGVETQIPAAKASRYTGVEPATIKPVPEATQAAYYTQALQIAFCQPNVAGLFIFHTIDEPALDRFQSGLYYFDETPKSSLPAVKSAARSVFGGVAAKCQGLMLTPKARITYPRLRAIALGTAAFAITCDIDCLIYTRLEKATTHTTTLAKRGFAQAGVRTLIQLPARKIAPGQYRFTVRLVAPVNTGPPSTAASATLLLTR
jgi:hypothetical protein